MRVLITGGAKELGRAFSEAIGAQGHQLVITGRDEIALRTAETELRAKGVDVEAHVADLGDPGATPKLVESLGGIDVLVNNGALGGPVGPTWQVDENEWWRTFEVNLRGTAFAANAAIRTMTSGRIINVVSNAGVHRWPYVTAYSVSKAAVIKLTENLAIELKRRPIAVLSYDPGMVDAGLMSRGCDLETDDPHLRRIAQWARSQRDGGRFTPVEQSAALLARIVSGEFDHRSGGLITQEDG
ncbi:NAD(P)-dependent dehydrogenase (short-subunit alcohol dehydrogenase family) [Lentzea atacamensis]|uniref:NAD(P)-dependent dehydrogenase (Short-subunit alcohol dehydrogenase family) n=2 Tax=Lentzea TaxID=165301 RepID=A0A316I5R2_9PSEU|nr:SDR family NAD(P)-dependent oxidoreductase [Lentzea atacamensis]PWK87848.1 NAD(P)-dependent dehydrogenase (short-subunit alcohol dehydrogenase family) [Lentzea atacamensis]